jgi:hypothetical protein
MVALPGIEEPGGMALVQVFGPNMATVGGAALGRYHRLFPPAASRTRDMPAPQSRAARSCSPWRLAVMTKRACSATSSLLTAAATRAWSERGVW